MWGGCLGSALSPLTPGMKFGLYRAWEEQILSCGWGGAASLGSLSLGLSLKGGGSGDGEPLGACSSLPPAPAATAKGVLFNVSYNKIFLQSPKKSK